LLSIKEDVSDKIIYYLILIMLKKFTFVDLFSGVGGFRIPLEKLKKSISIMIENDYVIN
jgi:hypothetical protein